MKSPSFHKPLSLAVVVVIGSVLGISIKKGWIDSANSGASLSAEWVRSPEQGSFPYDRSKQLVRISPLAKLQKGLAELPRTQQLLWLASRAEVAGRAEMPRLLRIAKGKSDMERAIATRWAQLDPEHMFANTVSNDLGTDDIYRVLFESWVKTDPHAALAAAKKERQRPGSDPWLYPALDELMLSAPSVGIEAMRELDLDHFAPNMRSVSAWASVDPRAAARKVATLTSKSQGKAAMKEVGKTWGATDPEAALTYAATLTGELQSALAQASIRAWTKNDPEAAAAFAAAQTDSEFRAQLGKGLALGLANTDPATALAWARDNLRSAARADAIGEVIKSLAGENVDKAKALISEMEPGGTMNQAVSELISEWSWDRSVPKQDILAWIERLPDAETRDRAVMSMHSRLTKERDGLIDFVTGEFGHLATENMIRSAAEQKTRRDPQSAVAWAKSLPADRSELALRKVLSTQRAITLGQQ